MKEVARFVRLGVMLRDSFYLFIGFLIDFLDTFRWILDSRGDEIFFFSLGLLAGLGAPLVEIYLGVVTFPP